MSYIYIYIYMSHSMCMHAGVMRASPFFLRCGARNNLSNKFG